MMQSVQPLMAMVMRSLREDVLPELATDHARTQMAGVLDILDKMGRMLVWSPDGLHERLACIEEGRAAIAALATAAGGSLPAPAAQAPAPGPKQADLEQALADGEQQLCALSDWLVDPANGLAPDVRAACDAQLRKTLRSVLLAERRQMPRADFNAMTGNSK